MQRQRLEPALPRRRRSVIFNDRFPRLERPLVAAVAAFRSCPISLSNGSSGGLFVSGIDAVECLRSLRAHVALNGVSWCRAARLKSQSAKLTACYRIGAVIGSLPRASLRSGARFDLLFGAGCRSEEHTSELQSHVNLVCRL